MRDASRTLFPSFVVTYASLQLFVDIFDKIEIKYANRHRFIAASNC